MVRIARACPTARAREVRELRTYTLCVVPENNLWWEERAATLRADLKKHSPEGGKGHRGTAAVRARDDVTHPVRSCRPALH